MTFDSSQFNQIEGPTSAKLFSPNNDKTLPELFFLGDTHSEFKKCEMCKSLNCTSLNNNTFFEQLNKFGQTKGIIVDVILEIGATSVDQINFVSNYKSALVHQLQQPLHQYDHIRYHQGDARIFMGPFEKVRKSVQKANILLEVYICELYDMLHKGQTIEDWFAKLKNDFKGFDAQQILDEMVKEIEGPQSWQQLLNNSFWQKFSRTVIEFCKLPREIQNILNKRIKEVYKYDYQEIDKKQLCKKIINMLKNNKTPTLDDLWQMTIATQSFSERRLYLSDIFAIARALQQKDFVVLYFGEAHVSSMIKLIKPFYTCTQSWYPASSNCLVKGDKTEFNEAVFCLTSKFCEPQITNENLTAKTSFNLTLLELALMNNSPYVKQIINNMTKTQILNWRSKNGQSIVEAVIYYKNKERK